MERRLNGGFFTSLVRGAYIWRGLYLERLIFGILRYLILIGKLYLWDCGQKQILPNSEGFKFKVRIKLNFQVEKYISTKNSKLEAFYEKWPKDISPHFFSSACNENCNLLWHTFFLYCFVLFFVLFQRVL